MKIKFAKMSGAGNDFVVVDNRKRVIKNGRRLAIQLCNRFEGIGADGLLLLEKSDKADFFMRYFNADGSYGGMCGNGGRCISWYAFRKKIAGKRHTFEALDHVYSSAIVGKELVALRMKNPTGIRRDIRVNANDHAFTADFVDTGAPHAVVIVESGKLMGMNIKDPGRSMRLNPAFGKDGTNVNFIERIGPNMMSMRTYERGVEDETLACGTGSVACSIVGAMRWDMRSPVLVRTRSGKTLRVSFDRTSTGFEEVVLKGPARISFEAEIHV